MIEITTWIPAFLQGLYENFGNRVWFVGLQGSYSRGEATEASDIDLVVILDDLSVSDIRHYNAMLDSLPHRELICGFLSGKTELFNWDPSDLFQLYHDTTPVKGSLDELLPFIDSAAVDRAIKIAACNIYHGCVHNMLYEKSDATLCGLYKSASFLIQAICFQQTGSYVRHHTDLLHVLSSAEQTIINTYRNLKQGNTMDFDTISAALFTWVRNWI